MPIPFFPDIGWFYQSAYQSFWAGHFPLLGITSSVKWIHQGPLWTYFLIPTLFIVDWHPMGGVIASIIIHLMTLPLVYWVGRIYSNRISAIISLFIYIISPYGIIFSLTPYDTIPVPLFALLIILLIYRHKYGLSFLFLGFLYQIERISIIFWPIFLFLLWRSKTRMSLKYLSMFTLGILPLVLSGPLEVFGPLFFALIKVYAVLF